MITWSSRKLGLDCQVLGSGLTVQLERVVGVPGLAGLDRLLGLMLVTRCRHHFSSSIFLARVQRLSTWIDKELNDGGELARTLESVKDTLNGTTVPNPSKTFNSVTAR